MKTSVSRSLPNTPTLNTTYPFLGATYGNVMFVMATLVSGGPHCEKFPPAVPAPPPSPGPQFRKDRWPLRNRRPELGFWGCQQSFRNWAQGADNPAGSWASDAMRALTGMASFARGEGGGAIIMDATEGVFRVDRNGQSTQAYTGSSNKFPLSRLFFDSSQGTPTGPENVPPHVWQPAILYLGRAAQV